MAPLTETRISSAVIGAAIEVHRELGPGLLERMYQQCLARELYLRGIPHKTEVKVPLTYKGTQLEPAYRVDLWVANTVIVEIKAVQQVLPVHRAQILSYLKLTGMKSGLLLNFHEPVLKDGIIRVVR